MATWKTPPKAKVYEALGAIGDGRVEMAPGERLARVGSSARDKTYSVEWSEDGKAITSDDNASHWQGYLGYPILAVLMLRGDLDYSPKAASRLAGVPWKRLNDEFRRDYDRVTEHVLDAIARDGGDRHEIEAEVDRLMARIAGLRLEKLTRRERPPGAALGNRR